MTWRPFADPLTSTRTASTSDCQRGRRERRQIRISTDLTAYLAMHSPWPDIAQVAHLTRQVSLPLSGTLRIETVYLITTLTPAQASPHRWLSLVCSYWQIENRLHYVHDVVFGEDRSRLRSGNTPQILAALRNLTLALIHRSGSHAIAASRWALSYRSRRALPLRL